MPHPIRRRGAAALSLALFLAAGAAFAAGLLLPSRRPAAAGDDAKKDEAIGTRLRVTVVRVAVAATSDGPPLTLAEIGADAADVIAPSADRARATGELGAVRYPHGLLAAIGKRGEAEVLHRGEVDLVRGRTGSIRQESDIPIVIENENGGDRIRTTQFKSIGLKVDLRWQDADVFDSSIDLAAVSARTAAGLPIISHLHGKTTHPLRDGYTAVFAHQVRIDVAPRVAPESTPDLVHQYFFLITRTDLR